jgi:hypothetical protein
MPIYSGGGLEGSRSHSHECVGLEQPPGLFSSQWTEGHCLG